MALTSNQRLPNLQGSETSYRADICITRENITTSVSYISEWAQLAILSHINIQIKYGSNPFRHFKLSRSQRNVCGCGGGERGGGERGGGERGGGERGDGECGGGERSGGERSGGERGGGERGGGERGGSERGGSERGGSERGGSERGGSERGGSERGGSERGVTTNKP